MGWRQNHEVLATEREPEGNIRFRAEEIEANEQFNKRLEELDKDRTQKDRVLHLGRPSRFLLNGGVKDGEILMEFDKFVRKSSEKYDKNHPFTAEDIKDLPKAIYAPIALFKSTNGSDNVILTELKKDGKDFVVVLRAAEENRKGGVVLIVNRIETLFPKNARGIVKWFLDELHTQVNKKKALRWLEALQTHPETPITKEELYDAANLIQVFDNPSIEDEKNTETHENSKVSFRADQIESESFKNWLAKNVRGKVFTIELPEATRRKIRAVMGRDFDSHNITINGIIHGLKNHGEGGRKLTANSIPIRREDAELIPYIMTAPSYVRKGTTENNRDSIKFFKTVSNGYVVVVEKEYNNSPNDMETINIWAEKTSTEAINARQSAPDTNVQNATLSTEDVVKIKQDAEEAIKKDINNVNAKKLGGRTKFRVEDGVAALQGDERVYNGLLGKVFSGLDTSTRRGIVEDAMRNRGNDFNGATRDWLASLADKDLFATLPKDDWKVVKGALEDALQDMGVAMDGPIKDNDARYVLWSANQVDDGIFSKADDVVMRDRLGIPQRGSANAIKEANEKVKSLPREWGIPESFATYHAVDSKEALESFIKDSSLSDEEAEDLREDFADPIVGGRAYANKGLVVIFTNKEFVRKGIEEAVAHESAHIAYKQITLEENKIFNNALLDFYRSHEDGDEFVKELQEAYHPDSWADELMAYFFGRAVKKIGIDKIKSGKIAFKNKEINNFVSRIVNIIFNGKDSTGMSNRPNETIGRDNRQGSGLDSGEGRTEGAEARGEEGVRFRIDDFSERDRSIARDEYERMVSGGGYQFQEAVQDSMLGLKRLYQAILGKKTKLEDVAGFENAYLAENRMSSVSAAETHFWS